MSFYDGERMRTPKPPAPRSQEVRDRYTTIDFKAEWTCLFWIALLVIISLIAGVIIGASIYGS